jgi:hypothetical protein
MVLFCGIDSYFLINEALLLAEGAAPPALEKVSAGARQLWGRRRGVGWNRNAEIDT